MHHLVQPTRMLCAIFLFVGSSTWIQTSAVGQNLREIDRELADQEGENWTPTGLYIGGFFALTETEDTDLISVDGTTPPDDIEFEFDNGYGNYEFIGWDYGNVRTELELGARLTDIDQVIENGTAISGASGELNEFSVMFNLIFDIPIVKKVEAYVGAGIGGAYLWSEIDVAGLSDSEDFVFAYQAMAGLSFEVLPRFYLMTGYRLHSFDDPDFDGYEYDAPLIHSIDFGLRYVF